MVNINWQLTMYLEEINEPPRRKKKRMNQSNTKVTR